MQSLISQHHQPPIYGFYHSVEKIFYYLDTHQQFHQCLQLLENKKEIALEDSLKLTQMEDKFSDFDSILSEF